MPRVAPPPYDQATCKCGHGVPPLSRAGRFRGLCAIGKEISIEASRKKREQKQALEEAPAKKVDGIREEIRANERRPKLTAALDDLRDRGAKLEEAVDDKLSARARAGTALMAFNEGLRNVSAVARALIEAKV